MKIYRHNVFEGWPLEDKSVQAIITSPPFWSLRKYDIPDVIIGGNPKCKHIWGDFITRHDNLRYRGKNANVGSNKNPDIFDKNAQIQSVCIKCKAWIGQHGLEETYQQYIEHTRLWAKEAWRVLRDDGVFFLNLGDSYGGSWGGYSDNSSDRKGRPPVDFKPPTTNAPAKCKLLIPHRVAIMLIDEGWICRNDIDWISDNKMPESVIDRFSKKKEYIFMFVKSSKALCWRHAKTIKWKWQRPDPDYYYVDSKRRNYWQGFDYYFNLDAVREPHKDIRDFKRHMPFNRRVRAAKKGITEIVGVKSTEEEMSQYDRKGLRIHGQTPQGIHRKRHSGYHGQDGEFLVNSKGKNPGDAWFINTQPSSFKHYSMWPEALVERMILCSSRPGDIILDPFVGSGTTLAVAERLNREGFGFDLGYQDIQKQRLQGIQRSLLEV